MCHGYITAALCNETMLINFVALKRLHYSQLNQFLTTSPDLMISLWITDFLGLVLIVYRSETEIFTEVGQGPNWGCSAKEKILIV
jgi:hypothetical protein